VLNSSASGGLHPHTPTGAPPWTTLGDFRPPDRIKFAPPWDKFLATPLVTTKHTHASTQVQIRTTYEKHDLYGVTGSTQETDAPLIRATHVLKT